MRALPAVPRHRRTRRRVGEERGAVTAETAVVLPVLAAVTLGLTWLIALGVTQVRVVDAARETARALARDDPRPVAVGLGQRVAPAGAEITVHQESGIVRVRVISRMQPAGGLFAFLPPVTVDAEAVAAAEQP